ncbi:hypothetical protein L1987_01552 [Smallanthus sonchifolius]|uniref:Uncharacterized protein n=1 Tax=Smallanthus sonchifolius TaxID=185202 RepID=A0ACB9K579_9ASTR|nr:hypothetical protein L1987_01552 [Smallanthus sonchifolius]
MVKALRALKGIKSVDFNKKEGNLIVIGDVDPHIVIAYANAFADTKILSVEDEGPPKKKKSACSVIWYEKGRHLVHVRVKSPVFPYPMP